jgi:hypothetical protein
MKSNTKIIFTVASLAILGFGIIKYSIGNSTRESRNVQTSVKKFTSSIGDDYRKNGSPFEKYLQQALESDTKAKEQIENLSLLQQQYIRIMSQKTSLDNELSSIVIDFVATAGNIKSPDLKAQGEKIHTEVTALVEKYKAELNQKANSLTEQNNRIMELESLLKMKLVLAEFKNDKKTTDFSVKMKDFGTEQNNAISKSAN